MYAYSQTGLSGEGPHYDRAKPVYAALKRIARNIPIFGAVFLLLLAVATGQQLHSSSAADPLQQLNDALQQLVAKVSPAIVRIEVVGYSESDDAKPSEAHLVTNSDTIGSGVILDPDGYIVTNAHVIQGARRIRVILDRKTSLHRKVFISKKAREFDARVVGTFPEADLAVLKIDAKDLPVVLMADSDSIQAGELVFAIGNPEGLNNSVSMGVISAVARETQADRSPTYIQTDAAINSGSSGGALVDIHGNLVGITTFIVTEGGGSEGLGFVLPSQIVRLVYEELRAHGYLHLGDIGVRVQSITEALASGLRLPKTSGLIVSDVLPGSSAEKVGIRVQDIIVSLDGTLVESVPQFATYFYRKHAGSCVRLQLLRDSHIFATTVAVQDAQRDTDQVDLQRDLIRKLGIFCTNLDSKSYPVSLSPRSQSGVVVVGQLAEHDLQTDLTIGDLITAINGTKVHSVEQFRDLLQEIKPGAAIVLQIERHRRLRYLSLEVD